MLHQLFLEQVAQGRDRVAVTSGDVSWTYGELTQRAQGVTRALRETGSGPRDVVAVLLERSPEALAAIFGVLMSGAAYVPLDPSDPDSRLESVLRGSGASAVVTRAHNASRIRGHTVVTVEEAPPQDAPPGDHPLPEEPPQDEPPVTADDRAYIIYTSGSTGEPKGVAVPHRGPVRLVRGADYLTLGPEDVVLSTTNLTFDVSCFEIFGALLNGARLVLPGKDTLLSTPDLEDLMHREGVTVMWLSAGLFHQHAGTRPGMFATLRCLIAGGDALSPDRCRAVLRHGKPGLFLNGYGPTENAVFSTTHEIRDVPEGAASVPIGRPIANSTAYVLRDDRGLADPEEEGELYLGGDGVALGYHNFPDLTRERFVPDPFAGRDGARLYQTGDMARWRPDGIIEFLGRRDQQVKVRGYRVELSEIETTLNTHPEVRDAAVVLDEPKPGDQRLTAWVVPRGGGHDAHRRLPGQIRRHLRDHLPFYMIPARHVIVDDLPLTTSGKVDRKTLLERSDTPRRADVPPHRRPRGQTERTVGSVWTDLLGVEDIARDDDFFAIGGQSLQATQVAAALHERLGIHAGHSRTLIRDLLDNPTLAEFAQTAEGLLTGTRTDTGTRIDFTDEARLGDLPMPDRRAPARPRRILITGGSGFLGVFLIDRLVRSGVPEVRCLVRASDDAAAAERLAARMRRYGLDWNAVRDHVDAVAGDLTLARFGLGERYDELAADTDAVIHNGSHVNFAYPYTAVRQTNVEGTREVLKFTATAQAKPLHYVSSIAVIAGYGTAGVRRVEEDTPLAHADRISLGYVESKWVAEQLVHQASERGLPVSVYRPYEITGTSDTGVWNTDTMMCALFRTIAETGLAPDIPLPLDFVPVDFTADALAHLVLHEKADGQVYHVTNPDDDRLELLVRRLEARGYPVRRVPYGEWVSAVVGRAAADPDEPMAPYLPMFVEPASDADISVKEMYFAGTFPEFGRRNVEAALAGTGIHCPPVDENLIDLYLDYFVASGFLEPAESRTRS
ncbi:amino acid adenylation domain-containing protein [Actinomadura sp. KC216]|uniref:amino acid adenylation domain-containing protein n=1 Tax=Actinomadura sp. KC216 TaxID=2530370 RepID=UPI0014043663|nr:amino acid adenylation domain-containing protein [Actinomadura sp. KC216]